MVGRVEHYCQLCRTTTGFTISDDGFFNCEYCYSQADDIVDTGVDEEQLFNHYNNSCNRVRPSGYVIAAEPISQVKLTESQFLDLPNVNMDDVEAAAVDGHEPLSPIDIGSSQKYYTYEQYYTEIRSRYLAGLQVIIQLQCQVLVEEYNVSPLIIGLVGPLWLRFLSSTKIMTGEWADRAVHDSETQGQVEGEEFHSSAKFGGEPVNIYGKRLVLVWCKSLKKIVPVYMTLVLSFLACHVTREAIMPSDILKWALEGKIPYFSAFHEIENKLGPSSGACPFRDSYMFRPFESISFQKLESMAANVAQRILLELPPINFCAVASRYCKQLCVPEREVLHVACQICEWAMPPELYLSSNESRIPSRACVISVLIVAIRIIFNINGYGIWESIVLSPDSQLWLKNKGRSKKVTNDASRLLIVGFLKILKEKYIERENSPDFQYDLDSYLRYCKEVVFCGLWPSNDDFVEEKLINEFWDAYKNKSGKAHNKEHDHSWKSHEEEPMVSRRDYCAEVVSDNDEKQCMADLFSYNELQRDSVGGSEAWNKSLSEKVLMQVKLDMEENGFVYIRPRVNIKRRDYLHYSRRRKEVYLYAVHADYYIILRSCAMAAQVETRVLHTAVLSLERRLSWLEKRINVGDGDGDGDLN